MFEQYESDRECTSCRAFHPLSAFSVRKYKPDLTAVYFSTCNKCRKNRRPRTDARVGHASQTAWLLPRDERAQDDKALDVQLRSWNYPVERGQLRWAA